MESGIARHAIHGSATKTTLKLDIDPELLRKLNSLPDAKYQTRDQEFTPDMDKALLAFWKVKRQYDVAKMLGKCIKLCRRRYEQLTEVENGE